MSTVNSSESIISDFISIDMLEKQDVESMVIKVEGAFYEDGHAQEEWNVVDFIFNREHLLKLLKQPVTESIYRSANNGLFYSSKTFSSKNLIQMYLSKPSNLKACYPCGVVASRWIRFTAVDGLWRTKEIPIV